MASSKCPPLGTGSVDFNAVNEAAAKGKDLEKAIKDASVHASPRARPAPAPAAKPAPSPVPAADKADG